MEKKKLKGIWIPLGILENNELSDKEKLLYSIILSLSLDTGYCYANNRYLGKILNITTGRVSKLITSLKLKKFIEVKLIYEEDSKKIERRELRPMVIFNHTSSRKELYPMVNTNQDIIYKIINSINKRNYQNYAQRHYTDEDYNEFYANNDKNRKTD